MKKRLIDIYSLDTKIKFFPFVKDISRYNFSTFKDDLLAAISVALLAIPQSIAYSMLANLPIQAGIFSAIFGSIFSGAFGSSRHLIAGPSTGVSILIQTILSNIMNANFSSLAADQKEFIVLNLLMQLVLLIGVFQLIFSFFNLGKMLQFVSRPVILGYFAGVGVAIIINQLYYLFGIKETVFTTSALMNAYAFLGNIKEVNWVALLVGIISILLLVLLKIKYKKLPNVLIMITIITLIVYFLNAFLIKNLGMKVPVLIDFGLTNIPTIKLVFPYLDFKMIDQLFFPALAVSMLSILEVSSISKGIATKSGQKLKANQEIFGIGISNFILSFFYTAMPTSGSVSRTSLNFTAGAKTRFASIFSGIIVSILIFLLWPLVKFIPLCALAAVLIIMVISVVEIRHVKVCFRSSLGDASAFLLTMISCLIFRLDVAFFFGIVISIIFFLRKAAVPHLVEYSIDEDDKLHLIDPKKNDHKKIRIIGIAGELFFAAVDLVQNTIQKMIKEPDVQVIILRLQNIYDVDASFCIAIMRLNDYLRITNRYLLISGISKEVWDIFKKTGVVKQLGQDQMFMTDEDAPQLSTKKALKRASELIKELQAKLEV
ncbi:MAG: SulP family inorganic anion transporter [Parachlamydiales bacterium]|jgi:SulP family sulfate permease